MFDYLLTVTLFTVLNYRYGLQYLSALYPHLRGKFSCIKRKTHEESLGKTISYYLEYRIQQVEKTALGRFSDYSFYDQMVEPMHINTLALHPEASALVQLLSESRMV